MYVCVCALQELQAGDKVQVKMSENPMPTINRTDLTGDWFDSLDRWIHTRGLRVACGVWVICDLCIRSWPTLQKRDMVP
jgi:hypothetical protein